MKRRWSLLRWIARLCAALLAAGVVRPIAGADTTLDSPPDMARIAAAGELRIALTTDDWPPFFFTHPTRGLVGLDIDLAREMAQQLGVEVRFVREAKTFDDLVTLVVNRRADLAVAYLSDTLERSVRAAFSQPYVQLKPAVLINRALAGQARRGTDLRDLLNHPEATIGVTLGSSAESFAAIDYPQARLVKFEAWSDITRALENNTLLAGFSDQIDAQKWQSEHPEGAISIETLILSGPPDTIAVAVHFEDRQLRYWLDHFLTVKHRDGSLARLNQYYVGSDLWKKDLPASP